ncbi:MAG: sec-independent protein translocase protein TatA [Actinomycetota bacterium]|jgi:sec-independent protein translocase protein TatA|nr:sec-independent protein translocase protein TatA [Actinomycetota bacterium]
MFSNLRGWEWLIIVALILLLFGAKRLPDAARGLGRSLRIFKAETKGLAGDATTPAPEELPAAGTGDAATPAPKDVPAPERTEG